MIGIDGNGRDGGGRREDIPLNYSPSFSLLCISLFFFLFLLPFSFSFYFYFFILKDTSKFQKNLHKIRIWRDYWFRREYAKM